MKIAEINPIAPNYLVSKKLAKLEEKEIENKNVSLPNQAYRDFNINFRGRTPENFYEQEAARQGCRYLRIDTNARNTRARELYRSLGYKEIGVVSCTFNGLSDIDLVLLEKAL